MFFDNKARRPNYDSGYAKYLGRCAKTKADKVFDRSRYISIVKDYCKMLAQRLEDEGTIDLPCGMGSIVAVSIRRRPRYNKRTGKWHLANSIDWEMFRNEGVKMYKDDKYTFGFIYSPRREEGFENLRCYGIRANEELYSRMRKKYDDGELPFYLSDKDNYV